MQVTQLVSHHQLHWLELECLTTIPQAFMCNIWDHPMVLQGLHHEEVTAPTNLNVPLLLLLQTRRAQCSHLRHHLHHLCNLRANPQHRRQPIFNIQCIPPLSLSACAQQSLCQKWTHNTEQFTKKPKAYLAYLDLTYLHWGYIGFTVNCVVNVCIKCSQCCGSTTLT